MSKFKYTRLGVAMAAAMLFAGQALATTCPVNHDGVQTEGSPACVASQGDDGPGTGLQETFDGMTTSPGDIDVYNDQLEPHAYWSVDSVGTVSSRIMFEFAGNAASNTFGIFDKSDPGNYLQLFSGSATDGAYTQLFVDDTGNYTATYFDGSHHSIGTSTVTFGDANHNRFGFYLDTPSGTYYSDDALNADGPHMVAYAGDGSFSLTYQGHTGLFGSEENLLAWEDMPLGSSDMDYNDMIIEINGMHDDVGGGVAVPEPAALGMFGLGLLMIGGFVALRRRDQKDPC